MARPPDRNAKVNLLRAAEAVFVEHGLDRSKVEEITDRAGRSKGSFYLHFASKEDAFLQIVESLLARMAVHLDEGPPPVPDPEDPVAVRRFLRQWRRRDEEIFEFMWSNRGVMRLLLGGGGSAHFGYLIDAFAERTRVTITQALTEGVAAGVYRRDLEVEVASLVVAGAYDRVARHVVNQDRRPDLRAWLGQLQRVVVSGMGSPALLKIHDSKVKHPASQRRRR